MKLFLKFAIFVFLFFKKCYNICMKENQNKNIFHGVLLLLVFVGAFFSWFSIDRAIRVPEASAWAVPMLSFSLFVLFFLLSVVLIREKYLVFPMVVVSFFLSLLFVRSPWYLLFLLVSVLLVCWGVGRVRNDLDLNVKVSLWKSLLTGKTQIILAIALAVSSQYFFTISSMDGKKNMPKLDVNKNIVKIIVPILGAVNPAFKGMENDGLTVDQYLLKAQEGSSAESDFGFASSDLIDSQIPADIPAKQRELLKQEALRRMSETKTQLSQKNKDLILAETRKQFSIAVGQDLKGDEKIAEVLAGTISKKINEIMQPSVEEGSVSSMLPLVFSLVLFFTILPLGSVLSRIWFPLIIVVFKVFVRLGLVKIKKEMIEKESIQY